MAKKKPKKPKPVSAGPTKAFFVRMLTRDIDLEDAILDLLDNCIDGIVRDRKRKGVESNGSPKPYDGYWAKITANKNKFEIWDNCGGIPQDVAEEYAFMLGRPDESVDSDIETVGMYGIGMKRAMFKMGRHSIVLSHPETGPYKVEISPEWLGDDDDWFLDLDKVGRGFRANGTKITVKELGDGIKRQFTTEESSFLADLETEISRHYSLILEKGFRVELNGKSIDPVDLRILCPKKLGSEEPSIEPYVFVGEFNGVQVNLAVGFYRPLASEQEREDILRKSRREHAGWTVICNDRVVLYNDKSAKTGWGTRGVPGYHNQFISVAGAVTFRSNDSMKLPLNTTKRGLDTSSDIYHIVLDLMQDGMKKFTSFTNHWKQNEELTSEAFANLKPIKAHEVAATLMDENVFKSVRRLKERGTGMAYAPTLPRPETQERKKRVCFSAEQEEIDLVASYYFDPPNVDRSEVGRRCFDESLKRARDE